MTHRNSEGQEFETIEEMLAEYRRNMTRRERIRSFVRGRLSRVFGPLRRLPRRTRWAHQRVVRGWDDTTLWRLDGWLAKTLGAQLVTMAEIAHGVPSLYLAEGYDWQNPDPDDAAYKRWVADLRRNGEALLALARVDTFGDEWDAAYAAAQDALRWVADNLGSLWD